MRRVVAIACIAVGLPALLVAGSGFDDQGGDYEVRAIFANGGFLVPDEEVRIAGAKVGTITEVDVTDEDDAAHSDGSPDPGHAVVVMRIDDKGFQDFRQDAFCLIRPQSLLGERYVECTPTQPRAAGQSPPRALEVIPDGEPGAGQRFLPIENTGKAVDLDLVQNIMRQPYPDRFRLILNDLGAGLAARGDDLDALIRHANPALEQTDRVLAILGKQNRILARLAQEGNQSLAPLAREREHLKGFIANANTTAAATAERSADLEASLQKLPGFLRELRSNMSALRDFADQASPTVTALGDAGPALARATVALGPFAAAATPALVTLGKAAEESQPDLLASEPVIRQLGRLGTTGKPVGKNLKKLLGSLRRTGGYQQLLKLIYFTVGTFNGFDQYGHFLRTMLIVNACTHYNEGQGCGAHFETRSGTKTKAPAAAAPLPDAAATSAVNAPRNRAPDAAAAPAARPDETDATGPRGQVRPSDMRTLLNFFMGSRDGGKPDGGVAGEETGP